MRESTLPILWPQPKARNQRERYSFPPQTAGARVKTPPHPNRSDVGREEGVIISVINSPIGIRTSQGHAVILAISVILGTQDLVKVSSLVDDGTIEENKRGKISAKCKLQGGDDALGAGSGSSSGNNPESLANKHNTVLLGVDKGV